MNSLFITIANRVEVESTGWAQLAPFGDFPGKAIFQKANGKVETVAAIQRLDAEAARQMVDHFHSLWGRVKRYFVGCPIYRGHPDAPNPERPVDLVAKGMITDLEMREDGLYVRPVFTEEGSRLVEQKVLTAFSGYWMAGEVGRESGQVVYRPTVLISVGLTNHPNLPVKLLMNEKQPGAEPGEAEQVAVAPVMESEVDPGMIPADQPEVEVSEKLNREALMLANARQCAWVQIRNAIEDGRILPPEAEAWLQTLQTQNEQGIAMLANLAPKWKTAGHARTAHLGLRKKESTRGTTTSRTARIHRLVQERMQRLGEEYPVAFAEVERLHPGLFVRSEEPTVARSGIHPHSV